jgi:flagellar biosynthetic protein FlhB
MVLLGGISSILFFGNQWWNAVIEITQRRLANAIWSDPSIDWLQEIAGDITGLIALIALPATLFLVVLPLTIHFIQTRFLFHIQSAMPNWSRMRIDSWTNRTLTAENAVRFALSFGKLLFLIAIAGWFFFKRGSEFIALATIPFDDVAPSLGNLLMRVLIELTFALLVLAVIDLFYQRRKYERQLMMTAEELREESLNR